MSKIKFMYIEADNETKEIKELLNKGLIKYIDDNNYPEFIYLSDSEEQVINKLKEDKTINIAKDVNIYDLVEKLSCMFDGEDMVVKNVFGNEISLYHGVIEDLISDEEEVYFPKAKQMEIFNSETPSKQLRKYFNELGKDQLGIQIESLLHELSNAKFQ